MFQNTKNPQGRVQATRYKEEVDPSHCEGFRDFSLQTCEPNSIYATSQEKSIADNKTIFKTALCHLQQIQAAMLTSE